CDTKEEAERIEAAFLGEHEVDLFCKDYMEEKKISARRMTEYEKVITEYLLYRRGGGAHLSPVIPRQEPSR
ncbi:unnamed protein product, partial [marine sediment metagenome]